MSGGDIALVLQCLQLAAMLPSATASVSAGAQFNYTPPITEQKERRGDSGGDSCSDSARRLESLAVPAVAPVLATAAFTWRDAVGSEHVAC